MQVTRARSRVCSAPTLDRAGLNALAKRVSTATQQKTYSRIDKKAGRRCIQCLGEPATFLSAARSFAAAHSTVIAIALGACVLFAALLRALKEGSRKYDGNVGDEYDAWTREGILEHYWGEHIHLGYYSEEDRQPGFFSWGKKNFKQVWYCILQVIPYFPRA
jgi:hypothetical protein